MEEIGIKVDQALHTHNLFEHTENFDWYCDSLILTDKCHSDQTSICTSWPGVKKYGCKTGCVFLFCESCVQKAQIPEENAKKIQVEEHKEHELVYLSSLPMKWSCNNAITKKRKCLSKHTEEEDYRNHGVYACIQCGFYICQSDGRAFLKPEDIEEEKKIPAVVKKNVTFHEHPLYLDHEDKELWYCDCLTLGNQCESHHEQIMTLYSGKKYRCTNYCLFTFCDLCVMKHMKEEEPEKKIQYYGHVNHQLKFYSNLPITWSCEEAKNGNCLRRHGNEPGYWDHGVYACLECKFFICDWDAEKEPAPKKEENIE